jgi:hypothetical protein
MIYQKNGLQPHEEMVFSSWRDPFCVRSWVSVSDPLTPLHSVTL